MATYREDMAKALEVMARRQGLSTSYDDISESGRAKRSDHQNISRKKRVASDDPEGPPDTKMKFQSGISQHYMLIDFSSQYTTPTLDSTPPGRGIEARPCRLNLTSSISNSQSPLCYWIEEIQLEEQDKKALLQGAQLSDKHMNGCGLLISKQFPELPKPQNTLYAQELNKLQPAKDWSIFFHFYSAHWVLSHFREGQVYLYDSLQCKTLHPDLKQQLVTLYVERDVELVPVQVQVGTQDCGCFVIVFSVSLLFGDDPSKLVYRQGNT